MDVDARIARVRKRIIERQRTEMSPAESPMEAETARLCMWTAADQFEILPPEEDEE